MKAIWALKPLSFDPTTREMLLERCPNCQGFLGWESSSDPWICEHCLGFDFRSVAMPIFQSRDPEALDYVAYMLDPFADGKRVHLPTGSVFESTPAGDVFQLAVRIALTCQRNQKPRSGAQIEPGYIEIAGRAILDWPKGFLELIESTPAPAADGQALGWFKAKPLRQLLYEPTLSAGIRSEIKKTLETARRAEGLTRACPSTTQKTAKNGPSRRGMRRPRVELFRLLKFDVPDVRSFSSFEALMTVLRDIKEVRQFAKATGVTTPDVWRIYSAGLAPELMPILASYGLCPEPKIEGTLHSAVAQVISPGMGSGALDLVSARFAMDPRLNSSWVSILEAVIDRRLKVWLGQGHGSLTGSLYMNDFESFRSIIEKDGSDPDVANTMLSQEELSIVMRKSLAYAAGFVRSGVMPGPSNISTLALLREKWTFGFELDALGIVAGCPHRSASRLLQTTDVDRIRCGPTTLWSRGGALSSLDLGGAW
ncbi:hypothetical protein [Rhizobium sp. R693]|uniref:hypothetical protein n=1 Tax=Rhizobium sp. R693 TaxID=1764276 RepID=UPI00113243B7|nr:hypothetical protein [Rhizobium sp. R693]